MYVCVCWALIASLDEVQPRKFLKSALRHSNLKWSGASHTDRTLKGEVRREFTARDWCPLVRGSWGPAGVEPPEQRHAERGRQRPEVGNPGAPVLSLPLCLSLGGSERHPQRDPGGFRVCHSELGGALLLPSLLYSGFQGRSRTATLTPCKANPSLPTANQCWAFVTT